MIKTRQAIAIWAAVLILSSLCGSALVFAHKEPKAEPMYVKFRSDGTSATLKGMVQGSEEAEYLFAAKKGQKLSIRIISTPRDSVVPRITDPESRGLRLRRDGSSTWTATLPKSGDYFMVILRDRKGPGRTTYTLTLSIK